MNLKLWQKLFNMKVAMMLNNMKSIHKIILGHFSFYLMERDPYLQNGCIRQNTTSTGRWRN
jgi:hypothetical protein